MVYRRVQKKSPRKTETDRQTKTNMYSDSDYVWMRCCFTFPSLPFALPCVLFLPFFPLEPNDGRRKQRHYTNYSYTMASIVISTAASQIPAASQIDIVYL